MFKNPGMEDDPTCGPIIDNIAIKKLFTPDKPKGIYYQLDAHYCLSMYIYPCIYTFLSILVSSVNVFLQGHLNF
ncbi:hypothetical protein MtrunA17_Chr6g0472191 [Medicago truncatula]|uniref:DUF642 domain-containing protein n=1 Tax=Medicago truncatula TaxID=3880 RepID=A0A396HLF9_MEDTR|nr:hypothetical protein MtrunA17_Chr6g0472191 [Medicago truncatula]